MAAGRGLGPAERGALSPDGGGESRDLGTPGPHIPGVPVPSPHPAPLAVSAATYKAFPLICALVEGRGGEGVLLSPPFFLFLLLLRPPLSCPVLSPPLLFLSPFLSPSLFKLVPLRADWAPSRAVNALPLCQPARRSPSPLNCPAPLRVPTAGPQLCPAARRPPSRPPGPAGRPAFPRGPHRTAPRLPAPRPGAAPGGDGVGGGL